MESWRQLVRDDHLSVERSAGAAFEAIETKETEFTIGETILGTINKLP